MSKNEFRHHLYAQRRICRENRRLSSDQTRQRLSSDRTSSITSLSNLNFSFFEDHKSNVYEVVKVLGIRKVCFSINVIILNSI